MSCIGDNLSKGTLIAGMEIIIVNPTSKCLSRSFFLFLTVLVACLMIVGAVVHGGEDVETLLKKMEAAYNQVKDYQTEVEVSIYNKDGSFKT